MKKILFVVLATCLTSLSVKAQISSFNIAEKKAFVYLALAPTADEGFYSGASEFKYQNTDWLEVAAHYPVWKGLNINVGASVNLNFKSIEDLGLIYTENTSFTTSFGNSYGDPYYNTDDPYEYQVRGTVLNVGVSYTFGKGLFQVIPGFGVSVGEHWEILTWDEEEFDSFVHEYKVDTRSNPYISLDVAYKNILIGFQGNFNYQYNRPLSSLRIGYGFPLKKSKMNF